MASIIESVEIARSPEDVFAYIDQLDKHGEWQEQIIRTRVDTEGPTRVGTRATDTRRVPGGPRDISYEITEHDPPRRASFRGTSGPVRVAGSVSVEPVGDGSRSRLTLQLDFEGRGLGIVFAPLIRSQARKQVPKDHVRLKERLESGSA
jgi:uncharacterized membrane protein